MITNWPTRYCVGCEAAVAVPFKYKGMAEDGTALRCFHPKSPEWAQGHIVGIFPRGKEHLDTFAPAPVWCGKERESC